MVSMSSQPVPRLSVEEYLEIERVSEFRNELIGGQMYAMSGASLDHNRIVSAVHGVLYTQLDDGCEVAATDCRLMIPNYNVLTYPDIVVFCGPPQVLDDQRDTLVDATVIVEVPSPSTANYDAAEKFRYYRSLSSSSNTY